MHESDSDSSDEPFVVRKPVKPTKPAVKKAPIRRLVSARTAPQKKVVDTMQSRLQSGDIEKLETALSMEISELSD